MNNEEYLTFLIAGLLSVVPAYGLVRFLGLQDVGAPMFLATALVYVIILSLVIWTKSRDFRL